MSCNMLWYGVEDADNLTLSQAYTYLFLNSNLGWAEI